MLGSSPRRAARPASSTPPPSPGGLPAGHVGTPPATPTARRTTKQGAESVARSVPVSLLFGAGVLLLMVAGMAASEHRLRLSKMVALMQPVALSTSSLLAPALQEQQQQDEDGAPADSTLDAVLSSASVLLGQQLVADGYQVRQFPPPEPPPALQQQAGLTGGRPAQLAPPSPPTPPPRPPRPPARWQLRCAVVNNLVFHIDVMAGWTYAFQMAGCDVTVYQNEHSLGIEDIMSSWLKGRFRKPEMFPGEAGDYHIVILPTFRDQHAELIQYLLQLPRLKRQRYFLTQHNPDWLLNHPNVDILQQQLLAPLLAAGQAAGATPAPAADGAGKAPRLRVQVVTLAPCVSNYTLQFLREMAFNITEGQTYAERVGSFRVRSDNAAGQGEDNSEEVKQWIRQTVDVDIPWMSPLVPWPPAAAPEVAPAAAALVAAQSREAAARRHMQRHLQAAEDAEGEGGSEAAEQSEEEAGEDLEPAEAPRPQPVDKWWLTGKAPPPPPPLGAEAVALLSELEAQFEGDSGPRHVCIQGKLENSRRNYAAAFEALSHPAVLQHLRASGERMLLMGHRSKWETVVIPAEVEDVVLVLESLPYTVYFETLSRCRAIMLAFAGDEYYSKKSSSTIATALNVGVPLVAERRTLEAYNFLQPKSCFVYDDRIPSTGGGGKKGGGKGKKEEAAGGKHGGRRRLLKDGGGGAVGAAGAPPGRRPPPPPGKQQKPQKQKPPRRPVVEPPRDGSYSAAILAALQSESSTAARRAVRQLKDEVMEHNREVAAAFMADTERQYNKEEQAADAAWWQERADELSMSEAAFAAAGPNADPGSFWPQQGG